MSQPPDWWRGAALYQIYPRSFCDSNGDGIGDLPGITRHLDHVASLGVDGIWISPFFPSPMRDFGYDVSDYRSVDPRFGSLDDFDALVARAHALRLKVVIDQVWSHTSIDHPWFQHSRDSPTGAQADWYVWADALPDGSPPNNWQAWFGGPAWTWEPRRGQYYFHNFLPEMPDLNLHTPAVQEAILDTARFWLDRGVDGFRLDTANFYFHDRSLRNNPPREGAQGKSPVEMQRHLHNICQPENLAFLAQLRSLLDGYGSGDNARMTVAEISSEHDLERMQEYTAGSNHLHTAYSFLLLRTRPDAAGLAALMRPWQTGGEGGGWPAWALSNHDTPRVASRWAPAGSTVPRAQRAQQQLALLACWRGTVFIYQGEELGLPQAKVPFEAMQDPAGLRGWPQHLGRDGCRTPMPWRAAQSHAGFTSGRPWLPVDSEHIVLSVDQQDSDPDSTLNLTRRLLALRRQHPALRLGTFRLLSAQGDVLVFERQHGHDRCVAAFNLGEEAATAQLDEAFPAEQVSVGGAEPQGRQLHLPPVSALLGFGP
jgi:alpha-glucosidase